MINIELTGVESVKRWVVFAVFFLILIIFNAKSYAKISKSIAADSTQTPNIVFILVDDLGWSDLGFSGNDVHDTPNIDRLAEQSLSFTNAYAAAPICSHTRA